MIEGEDIAMRRFTAYAAGRNLRLPRRLGSGIHGVVHEAESNAFPGFVAVKTLRDVPPFERERDVYLRLRQAKVRLIRGFHVPQLLAWDDELLTLEMTMVPTPFVLDFAGAWLDIAPEFSAEAWEDWNRKLEEDFEERVDEVRRVLAGLRSYGVILLDVHPGNIRFGD